MKNRILIAGAVVMLVWAASSHPLAADKEQRQMMADIRQLQEQTQQLQNLIGSLNEALSATIRTLNTRLDTKIDTKIDEQANTTRSLFANQKITIDNITTDVGRIREKLDDNSVRVGALTEEVSALRQQVVATLAVTRAAAAASAAAPDFGAPAPPPDAASTAALAIGGDSPGKVFQSAWDDYTAARYKLAIDGFNSYIRQFPGSDRNDDAQVNICNAYLNDGKYEDAIRECDVAIRSYPNGDKIPQAYFRKGVALLDLKRAAEARTAFEYIVSQFPNTPEASMARQRLTEVETPPRRP